MADVGYFEELAATNALYAWGFYDGTTLLRSYNMANATESPTGVYTCPLIVPAAAGAPFASSIDNNVSVAKPRSTLATTTAAVVEFRISGALASGRFFVGVMEKRDRYRI